MKNLEKKEAFAFSNYIRISPFKVRRILNQVKGLYYPDALRILKFMPNRACLVILKLLNSAVANAKVKYKERVSIFLIQEAHVDPGPILKRFRAHAQGRAFSIKKRMSHIFSSF
jgi:large subunit ribosomal protein L22